MTSTAPRAVVVTRETDYEALLARHATREQARFFLESRGQTLEAAEARHDRLQSALQQVRAAIPLDWRRSLIRRGDLDRFLFGPEDVVVAVGQDGLVANLAKYLDGQPVLGINPEPEVNPGVLVPLLPAVAGELLLPAAEGAADLEPRTMAAGNSSSPAATGNSGTRTPGLTSGSGLIPRTGWPSRYFARLATRPSWPTATTMSSGPKRKRSRSPRRISERRQSRGIAARTCCRALWSRSWRASAASRVWPRLSRKKRACSRVAWRASRAS